MDFIYDLSQTPVIGKRWLIRQVNEEKNTNSPRRSISLSPADNGPASGWKRPWMSQVKDLDCSIIGDKIKKLNTIIFLGPRKRMFGKSADYLWPASWITKESICKLFSCQTFDHST